MKRSQYGFDKTPTAKEYYELLKVSLGYCNAFLLVVRDSIELSDDGKGLLKSLDEFLISREEKSEWPGTRLWGHTANIYSFELCEEALQILNNAANHLFDWVQPDLPEDLCLQREEGSPWLVNIAHEKDAYLLLSEAEYEVVVRKIPGLMISKEEEEL